MISHRCRCKGGGAVLIRLFTSSVVRCPAAYVILAIRSLFSFPSSSSLFYHRTRIGMMSGESSLYSHPIVSVQAALLDAVSSEVRVEELVSFLDMGVEKDTRILV